MRLFLYILLILMPVSAMAKQTLATTDITDERHLLELLDGYIEKRDVYAKQKEEKLKQLKLRLRTADNNAARLAILDKIYRERLGAGLRRPWTDSFAERQRRLLYHAQPHQPSSRAVNGWTLQPV